MEKIGQIQKAERLFEKDLPDDQKIKCQTKYNSFVQDLRLFLAPPPHKKKLNMSVYQATSEDSPEKMTIYNREREWRNDSGEKLEDTEYYLVYKTKDRKHFRVVGHNPRKHEWDKEDENYFKNILEMDPTSSSAEVFAEFNRLRDEKNKHGDKWLLRKQEDTTEN